MKNPKTTAERIGNDEKEITLKNETELNFIVVYETIYKRNDFTTDELALLVKLIGMAPNFKPTTRKLADILKLDYHRLIKATKALQDKGFLKIKKYGSKSEWIINQQPIKNMKDFNKETLLNALLNFDITIKDLKRFHKLKIIDDKLYIETIKNYIDELKKITKTKWLND